MKRKITQIGRLFVAAALFFGASSWTNAAETTEIAINPQSKTADEGATWTFGDYVITNTAGTPYSTGGLRSYIKFSAADFAIAIPEGKQVVSFKIEGTSNYAEGPSILKKLNGEEFGDEQYVLPIKGEQAESHTITFTTPVTGNLPFTISGKQLHGILWVYKTNKKFQNRPKLPKWLISAVLPRRPKVCTMHL